LDKLRKQVAVEFEQLTRLVEVHRPLIDKCENAAPSDIELSALAAMLHPFYTGVENVFKRVCVELGETLPTGASWHRDLLDSISEPNNVRTAVISRDLCRRLEEYLKFRHFFRQAYSFQFEWEKLSSLVLGCSITLNRLEQEVRAFLERGAQDPKS
jgi:hypothetical protein